MISNWLLKQINKKTSSKLFRKRFFAGLLIVGSLVLSTSLVHRFFYYRSLRLQDNIVKAYRWEDENKLNPIRLKVWDMIDVKVDEAPYVNGNWVISNDSATHLANSAGIGEQGNMIIYGHNRPEILSNIRILKGGEKLSFVGSDGEEYVYQVEFGLEVGQGETDLLEETDEHVLTLYTCSGVLDSRRYVVRAKLLE